jgi:hypothetical protein
MVAGRFNFSLSSALGAVASIAILFAIARWWVKWPERTASTFVALMASGRINDAKGMTLFRAPGCLETIEQIDFDDSNTWCPNRLFSESRRLADVFAAQQQFKIGNQVVMTVRRETVKEMRLNGHRAYIRWPGDDHWREPCVESCCAE